MPAAARARHRGGRRAGTGRSRHLAHRPDGHQRARGDRRPPARGVRRGARGAASAGLCEPRLMAVRDRRTAASWPCRSATRGAREAPGLGADVVLLDLEDAVAPDDKEQARENVIAALTGQDWSACSVSRPHQRAGHSLVLPRHRRRGRAAGAHLDTILIPKVGTPADVLFVATMLDQIEAAFGLEPIDLHILIETALGMANVEAIAQTCRSGWRRWCSASPTTRPPRRRATTNIGGRIRTTAADPRRRVGRAAAALGRPVALRAVADGRRLPRLRPAADRRAVWRLPDAEGYTAAARSAAQLGCEGKWAIHPSQIALANEVFTPTRGRDRAGPRGSSRRCSRRRPRARARSRWTAS